MVILRNYKTIPGSAAKKESLEQPALFQLIRNGSLLMYDFGSSIVEMTKVAEMSKMSEITTRKLVLLKINHKKQKIFEVIRMQGH